MQQKPVSVLAMECHFEYRLGGMEIFVLALPWIIWKLSANPNVSMPFEVTFHFQHAHWNLLHVTSSCGLPED